MALPEPKGRQREVLYLPATGHVAVLGTAGSGKTTLAIHRSVHLANQRLSHGGKTLLLTFNRTLVTYLRHIGLGVFANVFVENYHTFARGYLNSRGRMRRNGIAGPDARHAFIATAITEVAGGATGAPFDRPVSFFSEEISWIECNGIQTLTEYRSASRVGRAESRVERRVRPEIWQVYEAYKNVRAKSGYLFDWDDLASAVSDEFDRDERPRLYRHIVIDEGQDFSPEMIRSLVKAVPIDGSITFFGDVAQQIFGRGMSWRSAGLKITKPWEFRDNYRNTRQIARLALAIAQMPYYRDTPDLVEPVAPAADGPLPTLVTFPTRDAEIQFVIQQCREAARTQSVAILVRRRSDEDLFSSRLPRGSVRLHREMKAWQVGPRVHYGTYHSAKGLEFDTVILPFLSSDYLPDQDEVDDFGAEEAARQDGRLLYVGVTRARAALILTHTGDLTELMPTAKGLLEVVVP